MKKIVKISALAVLVLSVAGMLQPANAICSNPRIFQSGYSYVVTPGCESNDCGANSTSLTDNASGVFWAIGDGDATVGGGIDNGDFPALGGWLYVYPGYAASINSTWAASGQIDGCIDAAADTQRCMAILIMDADPNTGDGAFALLTDEPDSINNYSFEQDGNINLVSLDLPAGSIATTVAVPDSNDVSVTVNGVTLSDISSGLYLDPACPQPSGGGIPGVIQGYQMFQREVAPAGSAAPDGNSDGWTPVGGITPLGDPSTFNVTCTLGGDLYVSSGIVFDSNYRNVWVSGSATKINCDPLLADPADLIERKPRGRKLPSRSRSRGR